MSHQVSEYPAVTMRVTYWSTVCWRKQRVCKLLALAVTLLLLQKALLNSYRLVRRHSDGGDTLRLRSGMTSDTQDTFTSYEDALSKVSDADKFVVLASVDYGYIDMAVNLYVTSVKPFNITNFLLVCSDARAAREAHAHGIPSVTLDRHDASNGNKASQYGSLAFIRKTHVKTDLILTALKLGYTVLIVDIDIVFFKNPIPFVSCTTCDIAIQSDTVEVNSGFYFVRPTESGILLHSRAVVMSHTHPYLSNQKTLARTLERMNKTHEIRANLLPDQLFPNGRVYFEQGGRMVAGDNVDHACVLVHNNWIVGGQAKRYRFKEHLLWHVEKDNYYSCPDRKYITYDNPENFDVRSMFAKEDGALRNAFAIAHVLNRTLILPLFHCQDCIIHCGAARNAKPASRVVSEMAKPHCYVGAYYNIAQLDRHLPYRESVFLRHPLVPKSIKLSVSPVLKITSGHGQSKQDTENEFVINIDNATTKEEIVQWFARYSSVSVLRFHSLYDVFSSFETFSDLNYKLNQGLMKSTYRQY